MEITTLNRTFGREAVNLLDRTRDRTLQGAIACLETFYYAFNRKDLETFTKIWLNHPLIQLNNPLGGMIRGLDPITAVYDRIFNGRASVWVELSGIVCYHSEDMVTFAGQEKGAFSMSGETIDLEIRTTRIVGFSETGQQWFQLHHHGSIDHVSLLDRYQKAVRK